MSTGRGDKIMFSVAEGNCCTLIMRRLLRPYSSADANLFNLYHDFNRQSQLDVAVCRHYRVRRPRPGDASQKTKIAARLWLRRNRQSGRSPLYLVGITIASPVYSIHLLANTNDARDFDISLPSKYRSSSDEVSSIVGEQFSFGIANDADMFKKGFADFRCGHKITDGLGHSMRRAIEL